MHAFKLTTAAIALSLSSTYMAITAEEGIEFPDRVRTTFFSDQMTSLISATRGCAEDMIKGYLGEDITIVDKFDRISGFLDEENLREDIVVVFTGKNIVQLSLNVTQQEDGYVFPYSLLANVDYNGSGHIDTFYYPGSTLPNPAEILAGLDQSLRHNCP